VDSSRQGDLDRRVTGDALDTVCQGQANIEKLLDDFLKAVFDGKKGHRLRRKCL